jgi:hemolysin III
MTPVEIQHHFQVKPLLRGVSHLVSFPIMVVLGSCLLVFADLSATAFSLILLYVLGTVTMFGVSALYHRGQWSPAARALMQRFDRTAIFLAIAGGYTPVIVLCLDGWWQWGIVIAVWVGSAIGVTLHWIPSIPRGYRGASYILVSWTAIVAVPSLWNGLGPLGFWLIVAGGVCYTLGAIALAARWPDPWPKVFGFHEVFHAFTVVAAGLQYAAIAGIVAPRLAA